MAATDKRIGNKKTVARGSVQNLLNKQDELRGKIAPIENAWRIELRTGDNPYADKRNKLTQRQVQRKRRLMAHVKKSKKNRKFEFSTSKTPGLDWKKIRTRPFKPAGARSRALLRTRSRR